MAEARTTVQNSFAVVERETAAYQAKTRYSPQRQQEAATLARNWRAFRALAEAVLFKTPLPADMNMPAYDDLNAAFEKLRAAVDGSVDRLAALERTDAAAAAAKGKDLYRATVTVILLTLVFGLALAVAQALVVGRMVVGPLRRVAAALTAVADSDLTHTVEVHARDEMGEMAAAVNQASESLRGTVRALCTSAETLATSSRQMSSVSEQIAAGANETSVQAEVVASRAVGVAGSTDETVAKLGGRLQRRDRQRDQGHHLDRRADQPARAERLRPSRPTRGARFRMWPPPRRRPRMACRRTCRPRTS